jgi:hypothetical protein
MNINKVKKISVKFPNFIDPNMIYKDATKNVMKFKQARNVNLELMSQEFAGDSGMQIGARNLPHIEGFNCTFLNDTYFPAHFAMQFTFASGEERKVMRLIERYGGKVLPVRENLQQWGTYDGDEETEKSSYENVNEVLMDKDFE